MRLLVFRGPNMAAALAQLRSELGPDALLLASHRTASGVEITAALEPPEAPAPPAPPAAPPDKLGWHNLPPSLAALLGSAPDAAQLAALLGFAPLNLDAGAPPLLLVGPPGAGKTLTLARLATRLVLAGTEPMPITADGQRAGATEQLLAYTRILQLSLVVAEQPETLQRALLRRQEGAPVLIDTPGIDPFDPAQREFLASLRAVAAGSMALVLPAGLDVAEAADLAAAFVALGATHLVATRLDMSRRLGGVLAAAQAGLHLAEAGIGPAAADGLVAFTPELLAARLAACPPQFSRNAA